MVKMIIYNVIGKRFHSGCDLSAQERVSIRFIVTGKIGERVKHFVSQKG